MTMQLIRGGLAAGAIAGVVSGVPSTVLSRHPVEATRAAGTLIGAPTLPRGAVAHAGLSLGWGVVLAGVLPRRPSTTAGAVAGIGIAALDLGLVGRRYPRIRQLPIGPQVADHVAFGVTVAWWLRRSRR
jgi:hypothetical protein